MIYVDEVHTYPDAAVGAAAKRYGNDWCHLWCDPGEDEALHELARKIGLKRSWFQGSKNTKRGVTLPHYDITASKRELAIQHGAVEGNLRRWFQRILDEQGVNANVLGAEGATTECTKCGKTAECRPYGEGYTMICYDCGRANKEETERRMAEFL